MSAVFEGIDWAIGKGAAIINMSLGLPYYEPRSAALFDRLIRPYDVLPVVAVGNETYGNTSSPGNAFNALSVGAVEKMPRRQTEGASFSSGASLVFPGENPEVVTKPDGVAPGVRIFSCMPPTPEETREYSSQKGPSMASPHVAGVAALLMAAGPKASVSDIMAVLKETAQQPDTGERRPDNRWGYGPIRPVAARQSLSPMATVTIGTVMTAHGHASQQSALSRECSTRRDRLKPEQKVRAIVLLRTKTPGAPLARHPNRLTFRQARAETIRRSATPALRDSDAILQKSGGKRPASRPDALGSIPVEAPSAGIKALANPAHVKAMLEAQALFRVREGPGMGRRGRRPPTRWLWGVSLIHAPHPVPPVWRPRAVPRGPGETTACSASAVPRSAKTDRSWPCLFCLGKRPLPAAGRPLCRGPDPHHAR